MLHNMTKNISDTLFWVLQGFAPISLDQLNATMSLMERIEQKYLVTLNDLWNLIQEFKNNYYILSIKDNSIFTYDNIYMDSDELTFFRLHEENKPSRLKVRTREYVDSDMAYFEFKQREGDVIRKSRFSLEVSDSKTMTTDGKSFYQSMCNSLELPYSHAILKPTIRTLYKRITLCSKKNDERITIDFDIHIQDLTKPHQNNIALWPVAIIETKSSHKKSNSQKVFQKMWYKPVHGCSKYCLGVLYSGLVSSTKHFKNSMEFIDNANKPIKKIAQKTSNKLSKMKQKVEKDIVSKNPLKISKATPKTIKAKKIMKVL